MMFFYKKNIGRENNPEEKLSPELVAVIKMLVKRKMFKEFILFTRDKDIKYTLELEKRSANKLIFEPSDESGQYIALLLKEMKFVFLNKSPA